MESIVILGAGLTGLSTAYYLEQNGFNDFKVFEKESIIGGLCRSIEQEGFIFDFAGHLIHVNNSNFEEFIKKTIGYENLNSIFRQSFVFSQNTYTLYPYQINLHGLPLETITECIEGYLKRPKNNKKSHNFYQWVIQTFGHGFGKYFFFPFQKKIFDYDLKKITPTWMGRFVPKTSLEQLLKGSLYNRSSESFGYNSQLFYPKEGGIYTWIRYINKSIKKSININHEVESIDLKNRIIFFKNGSFEKYKILITTIPLDNLLNLIKEPSNSILSCASNKLICNSIINFNIGLQREQLTTKHWIYYPEKAFPFYRIGFPHNFSQNMVPPGCSSIYGEFSYTNKPKKFVNEKLKECLLLMKKIFNIEQKEIKTETIIPIKHAYIIYNSWREKNLNKILKKLEYYQIYSIGRYGQWKYSSMQESILDGKNIAQKIVDKSTFSKSFNYNSILKIKNI